MIILLGGNIAGVDIMINKIIGFTISNHPVCHDNIDLFHTGIKLVLIEKMDLYLYLFGKGQPERCMVDNKYCLSFPIGDDLLDSNVIIHRDGSDYIVENDWLGSIPVFYNEKYVSVSTLCLKVLENKNVCREGMNNYFEFGYSTFERTPFENVKFLRYYSKLIINKDGIRIKYKDDPALGAGLFEKESDEKEVIEKIKAYINRVENETDGEIIIPTSGGYDSRLLNILVNDKNRIRSFTYGASREQSESCDVVYAKKLSQIMGIEWHQIELGDFYKYITEWFLLYGFSTHLHGMYHIEFYRKITDEYHFGKNVTLLSGIFGDIWAKYPTNRCARNYKELIKMGYTHGVSIEKQFFSSGSNYEVRKKYFMDKKDYLKNVNLYPIFLIRLKIILISYLIRIPDFYSFPAWTPFLNFEIATSILRISPERRRDRLWQKEFFRKKGFDLESFRLNVDHSNYLEYASFLRQKYEKINAGIMGDHLKIRYLNKIDKELSGKNEKGRFFSIIKFIYHRFLLKEKGYAFVEYHKNRLIAKLNSYYIIKAVEKALSH